MRAFAHKFTLEELREGDITLEINEINFNRLPSEIQKELEPHCIRYGGVSLVMKFRVSAPAWRQIEARLKALAA